MPIVDLMLQKKGGVGKSVCAALYCETLVEEGQDVVGIDTDPSNKSFYAYAREDGLGLPVVAFDVEGDDEEIELSRFNQLLPTIKKEAVKVNPGTHVIIDCGASSYATFRPWLKAIGMNGILQDRDMQFEVRVHVVVVGGADREVTSNCLDELLADFQQPEVKFVAWLNTYFQNVVDDEGRDFSQWASYAQNRDRFLTTVEIPRCCRSGAYREFLQAHFARTETFKAGLDSQDNAITSMDRIAMRTFWDQARKAIAQAPGLVFGQPSEG